MRKRLIPLGRVFFALGLAGLATLHFTTGDFVTGRAPALSRAQDGDRARDGEPADHDPQPEPEDLLRQP